MPTTNPEDFVGKWVSARQAGRSTRGNWYVDRLSIDAQKVWEKHNVLSCYCHRNGPTDFHTLFDVRQKVSA